jgi:hypothetical protein
VPCRVCDRDLGTPSESCRHVHADGMAVTSEDVALHVGGVMLELQPCCTGSLGKNPVHLSDERR